MYLQLKTQLLATYSNYLFFTTIYLLSRSAYPNRHHPMFTRISVDEILQMTCFAFYIRFAAVAMSVNRKNEKLAYQFSRVAPYFTAAYIIVGPLILQYFFYDNAFANIVQEILFLLIRAYLLTAGLLFLLKVIKNRTLVYYRYIGAGAISIIFFGTLSTLIYVIDADGFVLASITFIMFGFFADIVLFSAAVGYKLHKEIQNRAAFDRQLAEVQMTALSAQMNPHFLFNCMNSIQKYVLKNEKDKALDFLQHFSELMRIVLDNSAKTKVPLQEEISMLEQYILLEQQRLNNKFSFSIDVDPKLNTDFFQIPGMLIQPYVENAIWHGLMNLPENSPGRLTVKFSNLDKFIVCRVEDNGVGRSIAAGLSKEKSAGYKSHGMAISKKRLELLKTENVKTPDIIVEDLFDSNGPAGTRVIVFITTA
ncbi:MAG: histidine kinase [Ferruginibacter sp.]